MEQVIRLEPLRHRDADQVCIRYEQNAKIDSLVRALPGRKWSQTQKTWYVPFEPGVVKRLFEKLHDVAYIDYSAMSPEDHLPTGVPVKARKAVNLHEAVNKVNQEHINHLKKWMQSKRYSVSTIAGYQECLVVLSRWLGERPFESLSGKDVLDFNENYILSRGLSRTYQSHFISSVKLLFNVCQFQRLQHADLMRPKREQRLPTILSREDVASLIASYVNIKHKAMISLIYGCGLRRSELLFCRIPDVDLIRKVMHIRAGKGGKDRVVPLSAKLVELVNAYLLACKPNLWLFEGQEGGQYDERSLANVLQQGLTRAGIKTKATLHTLRHSYATHLLEAGTSTRYIQMLLGHKNSKTTEIYTHVSSQRLESIRSPFDDLSL